MFAYIVRRVFAGLVLLIVMSAVTMLLFFSSPVNPARQACGKICSPAQIAQVKKQMGYDKPVPVQWAHFLVGVVQGREYPEDKALRKAAPDTIQKCPAPCLGYSLYYKDNVSTLIRAAFPISLSLALVAFAMWIVGGIGLGVAAALKAGSFTDRGIVGTALVFYAFPTFFVGIFLYKYVAIKWQLVPPPGYIPFNQSPTDWFLGLLLPALTLALFFMAGYIRMARAFVLESLAEDYIRTAKSKGLRPIRVLMKHTMRAALTPLVTMAGLDLAGLLGGAIITEKVFNFSGLGGLAVSAATNVDLPLMVGIVVLLAAFVIIANIVVDVLYAVIDPRVKVG